MIAGFEAFTTAGEKHVLVTAAAADHHIHEKDTSHERAVDFRLYGLHHR